MTDGPHRRDKGAAHFYLTLGGRFGAICRRARFSAHVRNSHEARGNAQNRIRPDLGVQACRFRTGGHGAGRLGGNLAASGSASCACRRFREYLGKTAGARVFATTRERYCHGMRRTSTPRLATSGGHNRPNKCPLGRRLSRLSDHRTRRTSCGGSAMRRVQVVEDHVLKGCGVECVTALTA